MQAPLSSFRTEAGGQDTKGSGIKTDLFQVIM